MSYARPERVKKIAKSLLKDLRSDNVAQKHPAIRRFRHLGEFEKQGDQYIIDNAKLKHAQNVIAMGRGFKNYRDFLEAYEASKPPLRVFDSETLVPISDMPTKTVKKLRELVDHNYDLPLYKHHGKVGFNLLSFFFDKQHHQDKEGKTVYYYAPHEELLAVMRKAGCLKTLDRLKVDTTGYDYDVLIDLTRYMDSSDGGVDLMTVLQMAQHRLKEAGREGEELLKRVPVS